MQRWHNCGATDACTSAEGKCTLMLHSGAPEQTTQWRAPSTHSSRLRPHSAQGPASGAPFCDHHTDHVQELCFGPALRADDAVLHRQL